MVFLPFCSILPEEEKDHSIFKSMKKMLNVELLMKPVFFLFGASNFLSMFGFFIPLFYLPDMAVYDGGVDRGNANFLISIAGKVQKDFFRCRV